MVIAFLMPTNGRDRPLEFVESTDVPFCILAVGCDGIGH